MAGETSSSGGADSAQGLSDQPWAKFLPLLRCPVCHSDLRLSGRHLLCGAGHGFRVQDGVPILLETERDVRTMPAEHVSNPIDPDVLSWLEQLDGYSLNLGAGATTHRPDRCIEVEYAVFQNTTAVADAHNLPFKDDTFDAIVSYNTFEHLAQPSIAATELHRVLKPGGHLRVQSAFLQPLHEEPAHFYNATEYGLGRWFSDFEITDCFVPPNMNPAYGLGWLSSALLGAVAQELGPRAHRIVANSTLSSWNDAWDAPSGDLPPPARTVQDLRPDTQSRFSSGFELRATRRGSRADLATQSDLSRTVPSRSSGERDARGAPPPIGEFLPLLRCPICHSDLILSDNSLRCGTGHPFRYQNGVPILLVDDHPVPTMPAEHVSNPIDPDVLSWLEQLDGYSLNLGAGATTRRPPKCIELEYAVFRNTTAVADAHILPFKDGVFDAIVSYNTFEHLANPHLAAKELHRVLKPNGDLRVQSAFLQPLHEEPAHFYNATEYGLRRWFSDFEVLDCFVPPNMNPGRALAWLAVHMLWHMERWEGREVRDMLAETRLSQWARFWEVPSTRSGFLPLVFDRLPDAVRRHFSAGFELRGLKSSKTNLPK